MAQYLDFQAISSEIKFKPFLDWLNLSYSETREGLKGHAKDFSFIVNTEKNLFFSPGRDDVKGSVINFLAKYEGIGLRASAIKLDKQFLKEKPQRLKVEVPDLILDQEKTVEKYNLSLEVLQEAKAGYCGKGLMRGRHAFQIRNKEGKPVGYTGYNEDKKPKWLLPKGFENNHVYNLDKLEDTKWAILTSDALQVCYLNQFFPNRAISSLNNSLNTKQEELLKEIRSIIILNYDYKNIALRLATHCFVKIKPIENVLGMSKEDILG